MVSAALTDGVCCTHGWCLLHSRMVSVALTDECLQLDEEKKALHDILQDQKRNRWTPLLLAACYGQVVDLLVPLLPLPAIPQYRHCRRCPQYRHCRPHTARNTAIPQLLPLPALPTLPTLPAIPQYGRCRHCRRCRHCHYWRCCHYCRRHFRSLSVALTVSTVHRVSKSGESCQAAGEVRSRC